METALGSTLNDTQLGPGGKKKTLASRSDLHIARKIWHILGVGFILWLYIILPFKVALGVMSMATAFVLINDYLRMRFRFYQKIVLFFVGPFMREEERHRFTGLSFMCVGFWTVMLLFSRDIAILSLLFVMLGDPIAAFVGSKWGKDKIGNKSVQGFVACFAVCTLISFSYFYMTNLGSERIIYMTLISGLIGGVSELIQVLDIDDNLSMPVISASLLSALFYIIS